ncbi:uncharacterized protein MELLADRAFT_106296 [Melampsora larici-populina 98AG31]|uniref:Uncharacterized protein n=1 Tax=Melampsora larici-populina (strain 98AG31 / pathotype 3-4-7) TaxID=747676 RepID=F4RKX1_MELLP|nr:uncharacterized protein MELLADRAFT_106296 [Melampsora larici-populina 98AG31]EGG06963.1 hypothetical protein MELLADRAFT_106296 [Melampsora larici-populina 98AG31]
MKRKHSEQELTTKSTKQRITRNKSKSIKITRPSSPSTPTQSKQQQLSRFTTIQSEEQEQEQDQITPTQSKYKSNQKQQELEKEKDQQEQDQDLHIISNKNSKIQVLLNHYNEGKKSTKDYRDTIAQLSNLISKDLSTSLITWDHELRNHTEPYDMYSKTFTLWPLNLSACPQSEWTFNEEIIGLLNRFYFQKDEIKSNLLKDDEDFDFELNESQSNSISNQIHLTFESLLTELIKYVPRNPVNRKSKQIRLKDSNPSIQKDLDPGLVKKDLDPGLKWKDVLTVSSTLGIHQNVLDRTRDRLEELYHGTLIFDHVLSPIVE